MDSNADSADGGLSPERRAHLVAAKLTALVRRHLGDQFPSDNANAATVGSAPAVVVRGRGYGLAEDHADLGRLMHWLARQPDAIGTVGLTVFASPDVAADVARRASFMSAAIVGDAAADSTAEQTVAAPIDVVQVSGTELTPAPIKLLEPPPVISSDMWQAASVMADAGARVVDDCGRLVADVMGLEVARLTSDGLHIGVGEADRELHDYVHGHMDKREALTQAVETVRSLRPVPSHPLNRLARPRWLRSVLLDNPTLVGLRELEALPPLAPIDGIFDRQSAAAYSPPAGGDRGATVVCSVGVDPDLVLDAFDFQHRSDPDSRLILVVPERDRSLAVDPLLDIMADSGAPEVVSIQAPWESVRS